MLGGNPIDLLMDLVYKGDIQQATKVAELVDEIVAKASYVHKKDLATFYLIFPLLLDRLFGEEVARVSPVSSLTGAQVSSGAPSPIGLQWTKGQYGGWLFQILQLINVPPQSYSRYGSYGRNQYGRNSVTGSSFDRGHETQHDVILQSLEKYSKLIKIIFPFSMIFSVLEKLQHSYELKTNILPSKLQMYITNHPLYLCIKSDYHERLFSLLSRTALNDTTQRKDIQAQLRLRVDAIDYFLICLVRYPTVYSSCLSKSTSSGDSFYRGSFKSSVDVLRENGCMAWARGVPYFALLLEYFNDILLSKSKGCNNGTASTPGGSILVVPEREGSKDRLKELFLLLAIEFWIDTAMILHHNQYMAPIYRKMVNSVVPGGIPDSDESIAKPHPDPTEVVMLDPTNCRWSVSSCQCTYLLLWTLLRDAQSLNEFLKDYSSDLVKDIRKRYRIWTGSSHPWIALQLPVFDMLRSIFSRGDQPQIDREVLELAIEIWLLWIQPWTAHKSTTGPIILDDCWQAYIAHNLHFYATLLPCFLKMISKMNISPLDGEGERNLNILERVLRVFSPVLLEIVKRSAGTFSAWYDTVLDGRAFDHNMRTPQKSRVSISGVSSPTSSDAEFDGISIANLLLIKDQHEHLFPDRRIANLADRGITNIIDYSLDSIAIIIGCIDRLQKEVKEMPSNNVAQYISDIASILGFYDDAAAIQAQKLQSHPTLNNCRSLLYKIVPADDIRKKIEDDMVTNCGLSFAESRTLLVSRDPVTGKLTKRGKEMLDSKMAICNSLPLDTATSFRGDPLDLPCCSYEHPWLLGVLTKLGKSLNWRYSLPRDHRYLRCGWYVAYNDMVKNDPAISLFDVIQSCFRFNFRWFARYRVVGTLMITFVIIVHYIAHPRFWLLLPFIMCGIFLLYEGSFSVKLKKTRQLK